MSQDRRSPPPRHPVDRVALGGIVSVRDRLLEMQGAGRRVLRLESGDPSFDIPVHVREAMEKALRDGRTHYTEGAGIPALRQAAWDKLRAQNHLPIVDPQHLLVTSGAMHALYITFRALLDEGDEVIVPDPTWTETADNVLLAGGVPVRCPLDAEHGYRYDPERIAALVTQKTRAIAVNSPHNPTGAVLDEPTLQGILEVAERHGLVVVSDEAYEHVIFDGRPTVSIGALEGGAERVVSIYSLSKSYAMSGLRVGYLACNDDRLLERMVKLLRCTINGVNSVAQHGAVAALLGPQDATAAMARMYQERRDVLVRSVARLRYLEPWEPQGTFYLWCRIAPAWPGHAGARDGWAMTGYLLDAAGLGSAPGEVFGPAGAGCVRFSFSCATEQVERAAEVLAELSL